MAIYTIFSLYSLLLLGFVLSKKKLIEVSTVANLIYYVLTPALILTTFINRQISIQNLGVMILFFTLSVVIYFVALKIFKSKIMAFMAGSTNAGYFGIPFAVNLLGQSAMGISTSFSLSASLLEAIFGYESKSILKLFFKPIVLSFVAGICIQFLQLEEIIHSTVFYKIISVLVAPSYTFLGILLVGSALSTNKYLFPIKRQEFVYLLARQLLWILLVFVAQAMWSRLNFSKLDLSVLWLMALTPIAGNSVLVAQKNNQDITKTSRLVFLSSLFSLITLSVYSFFV